MVNSLTRDLTSAHPDLVKWSGNKRTEAFVGNSIGVTFAIVDPPKVWIAYRFSWLESGIEVRKLSAKCKEKLAEEKIMMSDTKQK